MRSFFQVHYLFSSPKFVGPENMQTTPQTLAHAREIWINKRKKKKPREMGEEEIRKTPCYYLSPDLETQNKSRQLYDLQGRIKVGVWILDQNRTIASLLNFRVG